MKVSECAHPGFQIDFVKDGVGQDCALEL